MAETKRKTFTEEFNSLVQKHLETAVTRQEVTDVLKKVNDFIQVLKVQVEDKVASNKAEMQKETKRIGEEVARLEKRVRGIQEADKKEIHSQLDVIKNELKAEIGFVESLIKEFDDSELKAMLNAINIRLDGLKIPEAFDATDLVAQIDKHTDEIKELKKRPTGTGGGVRRVFQPYLARFQGDGATKTFYLQREPLRTDNIEVWCTDFPIVLDPDNDFTVSGKTLTLTSEVDTPTNGAIIVVKFYA